MEKLKHYGIRGIPLKLFQSYLTNRKQYTQIEDTLSEWNYVKHGVPQGSILGTILILIYINDIVNTSTILKFILFADDTTIYYSSKPTDFTQEVLNKELNKVKSWLDCNKLSLNVDKSCYLKFSLLPEKGVSPKIQNIPLSKKNVTKYLGVLTDDKLSWKDHILNVNMKLRRGIGILSKIKDLVTNSTLKTLYYSFIHPYLEYNLINWCGAAPTNLNCIKISNKKAVRTILSKDRREPSRPLFQQLEILPFEELIKFKQGQFMWKINRTMLPPYNQSYYRKNESPIYICQNISKFFLPFPYTTIAKRHCTYSSVRLWNSYIPTPIKQSISLSLYKKHLLYP